MLIEVSLPVGQIKNLTRVFLLNALQQFANIVNPVESLDFHEKLLVVDRALCDLRFDLCELLD